MFPSNTLIMNVYLNWEMKVLGLDERTDYARDIFGPSWLKFDELRYEHAQKCGTNTKIMSKPFEITEQKRKPGNNPSSMHHDTHAKSFVLSFFLLFSRQGPAEIYDSPKAPSGRHSTLTTYPLSVGTTQSGQGRKSPGYGLSSQTLQLTYVYTKYIRVQV